MFWFCSLSGLLRKNGWTTNEGRNKQIKCSVCRVILIGFISQNLTIAIAIAIVIVVVVVVIIIIIISLVIIIIISIY